MAARSDVSRISGSRRERFPDSLRPELPTLVDRAPEGDEWVHEVKLDGYRVLLFLTRRGARFLTRSGEDWTSRFQPLAGAASEISASRAVIDGEVVRFERDGTTSFSALQKALGEKSTASLSYVAFDLLHVDGLGLRDAPLLERKRILGTILPRGNGSPLRFGDHVEGRGVEFFRRACGAGLEGIVSKRRDSPYRQGRHRDWLKTKCTARQELVIVGFTDPSGSRLGFGALVLGVHEGKELRYAGKCGTGFDDFLLLALRERLEGIERSSPPVANPPSGAAARNVHWVEPELVCEIEFTEWTRDGRLRHPSFVALREDKEAREVRRDRPRSRPARASPSQGKSGAGGGSGRGRRRVDHKKAQEVAGIGVTHPDRVVFEAMGLTKLDLARYYEKVAPWLLPHVAGRPLSLLRCPQGSGSDCFYQKHVGEGFPDAVGRVPVREKEGKRPELYATVDSVAGLVALVQMGVLEIHVWGCRSDRIERPDRLAFDLDPDEGLPWSRVVEAALAVRERLGELGIESFPKTTGGKGLHVVAPLVRRHGWDVAYAFSKAVAADLARRRPKRLTDNVRKEARKGRVFVDYLRNHRGSTFVAPYSTRARAGAPVSVPIAWDELGEGVRSEEWNARTLIDRLEGLAADPWRKMEGIRQSIRKEALEELGIDD
jgi:bifunctional non-homologous end joining protein LigD